MAFVPDQAFDDFEQVGKPAFLLFAFYCKHGAMSNNRVFVSLETAMKWLGINYTNTTRLNKILKQRGWIKTTKKEVILLKGFEHLQELKTAENSSLQDKKLPKLAVSEVPESAKTAENSSLQNEKLLKTAVIEITPNIKTAENSSQKLPKTAVYIYKDEPALSNQQEEREQLSPLQNIPELFPTKIPADFCVTPEMEVWAKNHKTVSTLSDIQIPTDKFVRHFKLATGEKAFSTDWKTVWELWMIREADHELKNNKGVSKDGQPKNRNGVSSVKQQQGFDRKTKDANPANARNKYGANPIIIK